MEVKFLENIHEAIQLVELFSENNNPYCWSMDKWKYYYESYTEGQPVSVIAVEKGKIVGHYGLLPVIIGGFSSYLGVHAYIAMSCRSNGLFLLSRIFELIDSYCIRNGIRFICSFPNPRFSTIISKFFHWNEFMNLYFDTAQSYDFSMMKEKEFFFQYSNDWYVWKFDEILPYYISKYDHSSRSCFQVLKSNCNVVDSADLGLIGFEFWNPNKYLADRVNKFTQPFSIKIYDRGINRILDIDRWFVEMGDSDTFLYTPI